MTTRQTLDAVREAIIAAITKADANFGYSYRLTKMDDTGEEHTLFMDGFEPAVFPDRDDGYRVIEQRRNAARTDAILAALDSRAGDAGEVEAFRRGAEAMQRKLADALRDHLNSRAAAIANGVTIPEYQA